MFSDLAKHNNIIDYVRGTITKSGKCDFPTHVLEHFSWGYNCVLRILPYFERSNAILPRIHPTYMLLLAMLKVEYHIKFHHWNKSNNFLSLVVVYGAS